MFTVDTSVHLNALNPAEAGSQASQAFLEHIHRHSLPVFSPTLLLVEAAAAVARVFNDPVRGIAFSQAIHALPGQVWVPLDDTLAAEAGQLGAVHRLRGADAVYAAVTLRHRSTLVTLDRQQLERLVSVLNVQRPEQALGELRPSR